jgi:hypothetical protein
VADQFKSDTLVIWPLIRDSQAGEQYGLITKLVEEQPLFDDRGVYWILVLSWLGHLKGGVNE